MVGAGLAGLSAAVEMASRGVQVTVLEASLQAGGRCRSYHDPVLEMTLDNGNHLILSGNGATFDYLRAIGAEHRLVGPAEARLDFHDVASGASWTIRPNAGPLAWWLLSTERRVPGTHAADYLSLARLALSAADHAIESTVRCEGALWTRLLEPFLLAALNTRPQDGSSALAGSVIRQSLARGGDAYRPRVAQPSLSAAFVDPAMVHLAARGGVVRFGAPVRALAFGGERVTGLVLAEGETAVGPGDSVILAVPPWIARELVPGLVTPNAFNAIVNGHFRFAPPPGLAPIVGLIGGAAHWVFAFEDRMSVTVSAAGPLADESREALAARFWAEIAAVHRLPPALPPWRIVNERRATFAATPAQNARRPGARTRWRNLSLAGDWTATGLPATIEGAIRSGRRAVAVLV